MKNRHSVIPAVYLLLRRGDRVLLLRRFNTGYQDGNYSMVAGHLEGGEPMTTAMAREAYEEIGITINPEKLTLIHVMHTRSEIINSNLDERIDFYFEVDDYSGTITNKETNKCDNIEWFHIDELPLNIVPRVKEALGHIRSKQFFSEVGW